MLRYARNVRYGINRIYPLRYNSGVVSLRSGSRSSIRLNSLNNIHNIRYLTATTTPKVPPTQLMKAEPRVEDEEIVPEERKAKWKWGWFLVAGPLLVAATLLGYIKYEPQAFVIQWLLENVTDKNGQQFPTVSLLIASTLYPSDPNKKGRVLDATLLAQMLKLLDIADVEQRLMGTYLLLTALMDVANPLTPRELNEDREYEIRAPGGRFKIETEVLKRFQVAASSSDKSRSTDTQKQSPLEKIDPKPMIEKLLSVLTTSEQDPRVVDLVYSALSGLLCDPAMKEDFRSVGGVGKCLELMRSKNMMQQNIASLLMGSYLFRVFKTQEGDLMTSSELTTSFGIDAKEVMSGPPGTADLYVSALWNLGASTMMAEKNYRDAEIALRRAVELAPNNGELVMYLVDALVKQNNFSRAIAENDKMLRKLRQVYPFNVNAMVKQAEILLQGDRVQNYDEAILFFLAAMGFRPSTKSGAKAQQELFTRQTGIPAERQEEAQGPVKDPATLIVPIIRVLEKSGRLEEALNFARITATSNPQNAQSAFMLGRLLYLNNDIEEAERVLEISVAMDDRHAAPYYLLGLVKQKSGDFEKAKEMAQCALHAEIGSTKHAHKAFRLLGNLAVKQQNWVDAEKYLRKAIACDGNDHGAQLLLAHTLESKSGRMDEDATKQYETALGGVKAALNSLRNQKYQQRQFYYDISTQDLLSGRAYEKCRILWKKHELDRNTDATMFARQLWMDSVEVRAEMWNRLTNRTVPHEKVQKLINDIEELLVQDDVAESSSTL